MRREEISPDSTEGTTHPRRDRVILLALLAAESCLTGADFAARGVDVRGALHSGYAALDLLFLFDSLLILVGTSALMFFPGLRNRTFSKLEQILEMRWGLPGVLATGILLCYEFFQDFLLLRSGLPAAYYYEYRKLLLVKFPGFLMIFLISLQAVIYAVYLKWDFVRTWIASLLRGRKAVYFLGLAALFILANSSGFGFTSRATDLAAAQTMNAPLLGIQVSLLAACFLIGGLALGWVNKKWPGIKSYLTAESTAVLAIWVLAILSWNNSPLEPNYLIDIPRAPNYQLYPSSDALKYDIQALDLLAGGGLRPNSLQSNVDFIYHPAHSFFLAVLHAISGDSYLDILFLQIVVLSLIPVLLYKLGSLLHTRLSGLMVSALYLVRERNALFLGRRITVANVKTLMTEPWALLFLLLFLYLLLLWVRSAGRKPWLIICAGGVFGVLILIRMEVLVMLPVIGLVGLIPLRKQLSTWLRGAGLAGISILLVITPWMIRNYQVEGVFGLDKAYYLRWNINRYLDFLLPNREDSGSSILPAESLSLDMPGAGKLAARIPGNVDGGGTTGYQAQPPTSYWLDDFLNSLEQTVYYLPDSSQPLITLGSPGLIFPGSGPAHQAYLERYVNSLPYWRYDWNGKLAPRSVLPLMITLGLIAYGLSRLPGNRRWIPGLFLGLILTQSAVYAVLSGSGGRYIAIVDWIPLMFYGIGLSSLISKGLRSTGLPGIELPPGQPGPGNQASRKWFSALALSGVLVAGLTLPLSETLIPARFTEASLLAEAEVLRDDYGVFLPPSAKKREVILYGKALYPRFFPAGERLEDDRKGTIPDYSYSRMEFYLVGTQNGWVTLPTLEAVEAFPHGSQVLILADIQKRQFSEEGQKIHGRYYQAREIYILDSDHPNRPPIRLVCSGEECLRGADR